MGEVQTNATSKAETVVKSHHARVGQRKLTNNTDSFLSETHEGLSSMPKLQISQALGLGVQTKLAIGSVNDKYEQEADQIATQIMGHSEPQHNTFINVGPPEAQRHLDPYVNSAEPANPNLDGQIKTATGGSPLDQTTKSFYENKMGYDFSGVRIHSGEHASSLNQRLGSLAFAYGNNIWLSPKISAKPSFVLAHELVHVVQQSNPERLQTGVDGSDTAKSINQDAAPSIQRFAPYWDMPGRNTGVDIHDGALTDISRQTNMFIEAPVPNADQTGSDYGKRGRADLYKASTTVGFFAEGHHVFGRLNKPSGLRARSGFRHSRDSAPKFFPTRNSIERVSSAPSHIHLGELKPSHGTLEALGGARQVGHYQQGFRLAARELNDFQRSQGAPEWNLQSVSIFGREALNNAIPSVYRERNMTSQGTSLITLKHNGREVDRRLRTQGRFILKPDPRNRGVLNYVWVPASAVNVARIPASIRNLGNDITLRILNPLRESPVRERSRRRVSRFVDPSSAAPVISKTATPKVQRLQTDSFNADRHRQWQRDRQQLRERYQAIDNTPAAQSAEHASLILEAHRAIESKAHVNSPNPSAATVEAGQTIDRIKFWTGRPAGAIGRFRRIFGRVFINVANAYDRMKERFRERLNARRRPSVGGLAGAAMKAIFNVLKVAARVVVEQTLTVLQDSLVRGVRRKVEEMIGGDNIEEMQEKLQEIERMRLELEQQAIQTAEQLVDNTMGPYLETIGELDDIRSIVTDIATIVNLVRWGARALACGAPPGLGCLWILAQAVLEEFAAMVVESCWFQEKIKPWVLRLQYIRELPVRLARQIVTYIRSVLPASLHDIFADIEAPTLDASEVNCDSSSGSGRSLDPSQMALIELQERLGEERFRAFLQMSRRAGIPGNTELTSARANQIAEAIEQSGASAADMRLYGLLYQRQPESIPIGLREFLDRAEQGASAAPAPTPDEVDDEVDQANSGSVTEPVQNDDEDETAEAPNRNQPELEVVTGQGSRIRDQGEALSENVSFAASDVLSGVGRGNYRGAVVSLRVRLMRRLAATSSRDGRIEIINLSGMRVRVERREIVANTQGRRVMRVRLKALLNQTFRIRLSNGDTMELRTNPHTVFHHEFAL